MHNSNGEFRNYLKFVENGKLNSKILLKNKNKLLYYNNRKLFMNLNSNCKLNKICTNNN